MIRFFNEELECINEADSIQKIKTDLINQSKQVFFHLLKMYYWLRYDKNDRKHWSKEIQTFCSSVAIQKGKNKRPSAETIKNIIWDAWGDKFDYFIKELNKDPRYAKLPRIEYNPGAKMFCEEYIDWLSIELSSKGYIEDRMVENKIDEMIKTYELEKVYY